MRDFVISVSSGKLEKKNLTDLNYLEERGNGPQLTIGN
jgi:ribonuclease PH